MAKVDYERLIDNANTAYQRCVESGSEWGQNYWKGVISALLKKAKTH
tara:strand:- start:392 stop:532 length:141 start_codon:yes stop_codon:yes gene_type:complete